MALQIRRGTNDERLAITPAAGELLFTTDTKMVYVGDGTTVGGVQVGSGEGGATSSLVNGTFTMSLTSTGTISLPGGGTITNSLGTSGDGNGFGTIGLIPDSTLESSDQYVILDPTSPGHIHIRAGGLQDNSMAALFLGGENSHVQVWPGNDPTVSIRSNNHDWIFNTNGSLTFPSGGNIVFDSSATSIVTGVSSIEFADGTTQTTAFTGTQAGSPGGSDTQLQYNNSGTFGGIVGVTSNGTKITFTNTSKISIGGGTAAQVLSTDGTGNLSWVSQSGGGEQPVNKTIVITVGDGQNYNTDYSSYGADIWFDTICEGPDDTVFAAGGWSGSDDQAMIYQFDKNGQCLWSWSSSDPLESGSIQSITYDEINGVLSATYSINDTEFRGSRIVKFIKNSNATDFYDRWIFDSGTNVEETFIGGYLDIFTVGNVSANTFIAGEWEGNFIPSATNAPPAAGSTIGLLYLNKSDMTKVNGRYPNGPPDTGWRVVRSDGTVPAGPQGGAQVGFLWTLPSGWTTNGSGGGVFSNQQLRINYNENKYYAFISGGSGWATGNTITIPGSAFGGVNGGLEIANATASSVNQGNKTYSFSKASYATLGTTVQTGWYIGNATNGFTSKIVSVTDGDTDWVITAEEFVGSAAYDFFSGNNLVSTVVATGGGNIDYLSSVKGAPYTDKLFFNFSRPWAQNTDDFSNSSYTYTVEQSTQTDVFIKTPQFTKTIAGAQTDQFKDAIYVPSLNSYYLCGGSPRATGNSGMLAKISSTGTLDWVLSGTDLVYSVTTDGTNLFFSSSYGNYTISCVNATTGSLLWQSDLNSSLGYYNDYNVSLQYKNGYLYAVGAGNLDESDYTGMIVEKIDPATGAAVWIRFVESISDNIYTYYWSERDTIAVTADAVYAVAYSNAFSDNRDNGLVIKVPIDGGESYKYGESRPQNIDNKFSVSGKFSDGTDLSTMRVVSQIFAVEFRTDLTLQNASIAETSYSGDNAFPYFSVTVTNQSEDGEVSFNDGTPSAVHNPVDTPISPIDWGNYSNTGYNLQLSDRGKFIRTTWDYSNDVAVNVLSDTVVNFPIGTVITLVNLYEVGNEKKIIISSTTSDQFGKFPRIYCAGKTNPIYSQLWAIGGIGTSTLLKTGPNEWLLSGLSGSTIDSPYPASPTNVTVPEVAITVPSVGSTNVTNNVAWYTFDVVSSSLTIDSVGSNTSNPYGIMIVLYNNSGTIVNSSSDEYLPDNIRTFTWNGNLTPGKYFLGVVWNNLGTSPYFDASSQEPLPSPDGSLQIRIYDPATPPP